MYPRLKCHVKGAGHSITTWTRRGGVVKSPWGSRQTVDGMYNGYFVHSRKKLKNIFSKMEKKNSIFF